MNGILNVLKPPGMTSHDVVSFVRRVFGQKKVGHAGTLDPAAAGVLPVFLGAATRLIEYSVEASKSYRAEITFGFSTDTGDDTGTVISEAAVSLPDKLDMQEVLAAFQGTIMQIPPMYSAIKTGGKKLYELARTGQFVEVPPRQVAIFSVTLLHYESKKIVVDVDCSKGTYIRTLCQDIGRSIGCPATMSFLVRSRVGNFVLSQAHTLEEISVMRDRALLPLDYAVSHLPSIALDAAHSKAIIQGKSFAYSPCLPGPVRLYDDNRTLLGIGRFDQLASLLKPVKILATASDRSSW